MLGGHAAPQAMLGPATSLISQRLDLPPAWDGVPVEWSEWSDSNTSLLLHVPPEQMACSECGVVDEPPIRFGKRPAGAGETVTCTRTKTTKSGHKYEVSDDVEAWPVRDLIASRCRLQRRRDRSENQ